MKIKQMTILAVASAAVSLLSASAATAQVLQTPPVTASPAEAAEYLAYSKCQLCHGPQGHSISPVYPALAGQKAWYIVEQLQAFRDHTRGDPYARGMMWGMASQLDDTQIAALAEFYSKQTPFASDPAPFLGSYIAGQVAKGKSIYNEGIAATGVPPCSACHQADAAGNDQFPRLAGQHAQYVLKQIASFQNNMRNVAVMHGVAQGLKGDEMRAVAAYLEAQR